MTEDRRQESIKFDLAYNFDKRLIEALTENGIVSGVYAKMKHDVIGGGRASLILPDVTWETIEQHVQLCHKKNIRFNYLLNALSLGNNEFVKEHHRKILELLDNISESKVDSVTVANPYLCEMIKKQYPHLEVSVSVNMRIRSLQQIRYWEGFGADEITLDQLVNRDFGLLREILKYTKQTGTRIRLFANNLCLHDCPIRTNHGISNSHASQTGQYTLDSHILYEYYLCTLLKMSNPTKLISATWIRPDDVHYYEDLMKEVGNHNLSLKLVERASTTEYLLKIIEAYSNRSYDGNLMDIIYAIQQRFLKDPEKQEKNLPTFFQSEFQKGITTLKA